MHSVVQVEPCNIQAYEIKLRTNVLISTLRTSVLRTSKQFCISSDGGLQSSNTCGLVQCLFCCLWVLALVCMFLLKRRWWVVKFGVPDIRFWQWNWRFECSGRMYCCGCYVFPDVSKNRNAIFNYTTLKIWKPRFVEIRELFTPDTERDIPVGLKLRQNTHFRN
jgi:hypothetical protein